MVSSQIDFELFVLKQIIRQDVRYASDSCRFEHPTQPLSDMPDRKQIIIDEGHIQGYSDDRILRMIYAVVNSLHQFKQRIKRPVFVSIELDDYQHLPLGGIVAINATTSSHQDFSIQLMRIGFNRFVVLESSNTGMFQPAYIYKLIGVDYISTINNATFTFFNEDSGNNSFISHIYSISVIQPSYVELALEEGSSNDCLRYKHVLHKNPMVVLLHEYSQKLHKYVDLKVHQRVCPAESNVPVDDLILFVLQLKASVNCCNTVTDVENCYPKWLDFCRTNGISVMVLDSLINLFWQYRINNTVI